MKFIFIFIFFSLNSISAATDRFICKKKNSNSLIINFYVIKNKIIMSGFSSNEEYKIIFKNNNGLFAINAVYIGNEFGVETLLFNFLSKNFLYKSIISGERKNNFVTIEGICSIVK